MAAYNTVIKKRNAANNGWDSIFPVTRAENVFDSNGNSVAAHLAETAEDDVHGLLSDGKIIEESGENANGRYVRFADGTQVCYGTFEFTSSYEDLAEHGTNLPEQTFPSSFISRPDFMYLDGQANSATSAVTRAPICVKLGRWFDDTTVNPNSGQIGYNSSFFSGRAYIAKDDSLWSGSGEADFKFRFLAIGRWK